MNDLAAAEQVLAQLESSAPGLAERQLAKLRERPFGFSLFAALRVIERAYAGQPRLGESRKAADDVVRLGQAPHLSFAPSDLASAAMNEEGRLSLEQYGFGLFGPNGALPLHLTELAYERRRQKEDGTIVDFLNLFQHRLISLFYRAWADSEPAVSLDRPDEDRFREYVGALIGLAPDSAWDADSVPDYVKLGRAGRFAPATRSTDGLEAILNDYFGIPVEVRQFSGAWLDIPPDLHCRLGDQQLGMTTTLGGSTWQCQHKFEIVLGPLPRAAFADFLPGAPGLTQLHDVVRFYTNDEWAWQVRLLLRDVEISGIRLGGGGQHTDGRRPGEGNRRTGDNLDALGRQDDAGQLGEGGRRAIGGPSTRNHSANSNGGECNDTSQLGWTSWLGARRAGAEDVVIQDTRASAASNHTEFRVHNHG